MGSASPSISVLRDEWRDLADDELRIKLGKKGLTLPEVYWLVRRRDDLWIEGMIERILNRYTLDDLILSGIPTAVSPCITGESAVVMSPAPMA
jgi:hypothetical protein